MAQIPWWLNQSKLLNCISKDLVLNSDICDFKLSQVFQAKECGNPGITKRSTDDFFLEGNSRQRRDAAALARTTSQVNLDK